MPEFRMYYDETGRVTQYAMEPFPEGNNYVVIDVDTYLRCRHDIMVIDGEIVELNECMVVSKLKPSLTGTKCASVDVCLVVDDTYKDNTIIWDIVRNEFS